MDDVREEVYEDRSAVELEDREEELNDTVDNEVVIVPEVKVSTEETMITFDSEISEDSGTSQVTAWEGQASADTIVTIDSVIVQLEAEEVSSESLKLNVSDRPYGQQEWIRHLDFYCFLIVMLLLSVYLLFLLGDRIFGYQ